ncbi:Phosphoribosyl pyrophosphokinase [Pleurostoma richardsiae]|uniref:ribose-phosphate diphosphokinase n=1 Tax=Pleurostoma richardsiae TaxID=41990 RepID=A0AA38SAK8_9PEZI|nr:Phosphoribosyl pyrophosphokinase [Pleurostoma richardsiae]
MVRNITILGGNSHPELVERICNILGIGACDRILTKFSSGETRCEINGSVRSKDVYIIQTGSGKVNDVLVELLIMMSALKTGSAMKVTAVLPLFPYSRQPDVPYRKAGAPLSKAPAGTSPNYTFESVPPTPGLGSAFFESGADITRLMRHTSISDLKVSGGHGHRGQSDYASPFTGGFTNHDYENPRLITAFEAMPGYKKWVAQAGSLVADLLTCAGADHIITLDLHDSQYQGFFDVPVDNLYARPLLSNYITQHIENYKDAVIVSPDAGGAKRAAAIADSLGGMSLSLIHKERQLMKTYERQNASMMLVGDVANKVCILVDDMIDTGNTITRAAKLLKKEGATKVYAIVTHAVLSGDAVDRIKQSAIDRLVTTNSVPQDDHKTLLGDKLDVVDIAPIIAEAIRRSHHGESMSALFQYD